MSRSARTPRSRPVFLNLAQITLPVGALTSILHRLSGVLLATGVPVLLYLLQGSLGDAGDFSDTTALLRQPVVKIFLIALAWALAHHMLAGVRHMLTDIDIGSSLGKARRTAWGVNLAAMAIAVLAAGVVL
ncbi:MAG: succinate dehydrogenase, cytochrome b556 subunit [Simplicispira suum]|uniref:succinate dehydrogenase, cytochrome b556 subunit n=1 Tax=Simplicispira suum TaxID=2109915 RepID=UPI001C6CB11A|nr:succinate dehydrogenase, cytochrome b556 subunit [Simplicispira suum]MBW7833358.1 succinate dehydrogenase, cytochrome b556 subunit [Simplicispira suum]